MNRTVCKTDRAGGRTPEDIQPSLRLRLASHFSKFQRGGYSRRSCEAVDAGNQSCRLIHFSTLPSSKGEDARLRTWRCEFESRRKCHSHENAGRCQRSTFVLHQNEGERSALTPFTPSRVQIPPPEVRADGHKCTVAFSSPYHFYKVFPPRSSKPSTINCGQDVERFEPSTLCQFSPV